MQSKEYVVTPHVYYLYAEDDVGDVLYDHTVTVHVVSYVLYDPYSTGDYWYSLLEYEKHSYTDDNGDEITEDQIEQRYGKEAFAQFEQWLQREVF